MRTPSLPLALAAALLVSPAGAQTIENWPAPPIWSPPAQASDGDSAGKLGAPTSNVPFVGITPCRIVDTRGPVGPFGGPALPGSLPRSFDLNDGPCPGIPPAVEAYSLNITVTNTQGPGFILINPTGGPVAVVSTLNYSAGQTLANAAVVAAGTNGSVDFTAGVSGTDLIIDINGYYAGSVQTRVSGVCAPGSSIRAVNADGTVVCEADDNTTYTAGLGLTLGGTTFNLNTSYTDGRYWSQSGNSGTNVLFDFLGTTDNTPLLLKVNGQHALRLEPNATSPNVVGGHGSNAVTNGIGGATIGGGGIAGFPNTVTGYHGTVGGGADNHAGGAAFTYATIGGGLRNVAGNYSATVGGGYDNEASGFEATVGGGVSNEASSQGATVAGGANNEASGLFSTVPGGADNTASGNYSFAAGNRAKAIWAGSFVWADSSPFDFASGADDQFRVRCVGGARFVSAIDGAGVATAGVRLLIGDNQWVALSDRDSKDSFAPVDKRELLERLAAIPIETWRYKTQDPSIRHIGPVAQDFFAAFGVGSDDRFIGTIDADGVALAAIQGLYQLLHERDASIEELHRELADLKTRLQTSASKEE